MKVRLGGKDGATHFEGDLPKSHPLILTVEDGDAHIQVEISQRELRIGGDGGTARRGTWDMELYLPRINEKS